MTLQEYMDAENLTDAQLASLVGVSRPYITKIRLRARQPSLRVATDIAKHTGLPAETFVKGVQ